MEGKELYNNEDEELDPKSKKEQEDADDFGLPEIEDSDDKPGDLGDPYSGYQEDKIEEENYSYSSDDYTSSTDSSDSSDDYTSSTDSSDSDDDYNNEVDEADSSEDEQSLEEKYEQKKNPVGWIIFGVFVLIAIILGVIWFLNKEPEQESQPPPIIEQPVQETEPEVIEEEPEPVAEPVKQPGVYEINEPTGRYHVIVASSIDVDLIRDYGNKLAKQGMTCNILAPRGNKKFHRLSIADYVLLDDANYKSNEMKGSLGDDVWVIRF